MSAPSAYDTPLPLDLDEDVPLPFGDRVEELTPDQEVRRLREALAGCLAWVDGYPAPPAFRVREWRQLAGRPAVVDEPATPEERRDDGIARAAAKWTDDEVTAVDKAIATVARTAARTAARAAAIPRGVIHGLDASAEFTTADVWAELGPGFPVTKGIAGRMTAAKSAGLIANTGRTIIAPRDATGPNHGQRLTVWRAL
jgi:hypothetical protein